MTDLLQDLPLRRHPRQARSRAKVSRALDAAERLLDTDGVEALNLTRVASEAGLTAGALHQYLPDRDVIIEVLSARYHRRLEALMEAAVASVDGQDPIGATLDAITEVYRDSDSLRAQRLRAGPHDSSEHYRRMTAILERALLAHGLVSPERSTAVAGTLFFAVDGVFRESFRRSPQGDPELLVEVERLVRAYLPA